MKLWSLVLMVACAGCGDSDYDVAVRNGAKKLSKVEAHAALADHTLIGAPRQPAEARPVT